MLNLSYIPSKHILLTIITTLIYYFYYVGKSIKTQFHEDIYEKRNIFDKTQFYSPFLIADIKFVIKNEKCPNGYEDDLFHYEYQGTKPGCYCNDPYKKYVKEGYCCNSDSKYQNQQRSNEKLNNEQNEKEANSRKLSNKEDCPCNGQDINPVESKVLKYLSFYNQNNGQQERVKGCYLYLDDYTFETKTPSVKQSGSMYCENKNDILCGSDYNAICFPKYFGCPIVRIHFDDNNGDPDYLFDKNDDLEKIEISDNYPFYFYIQRMSKYDEDPLTPDSFVISEGNGPCEDNQQNFSSNRDKYSLEIQQREECDNIDIGYLPVGIQFGEDQFFKINGQGYYNRLKNLPKWEKFDNQYKYRMYQKGIRGESVQCRQYQQLYQQFKQKIEKLDEKVQPIVKIIFLSMWPNYDAYYDQTYDLNDYKAIVKSEKDCPGKLELQYIFESLEGDIKQNMETSRKVYVWMTALPIQFFFGVKLFITQPVRKMINI
ncbi:hypothetical protein PPERSA_09121 [Pseudocohnilembus persalinus]|uniref:Transmembrane protein n=1 Tax=Pseudocohnilembus persalinus TaxID=266149 RepID=A0A0V0QWM4_PSEPJ|nr:hypothetical protein PPERSA_09121 [Pseudocohnilembus persalinus]|eukprot:KRX06719.1 hypothetical protein PPERSA_09121 [Pseudocohnilembus persalinus]